MTSLLLNLQARCYTFFFSWTLSRIVFNTVEKVLVKLILHCHNFIGLCCLVITNKQHTIQICSYLNCTKQMRNKHHLDIFLLSVVMVMIVIWYDWKSHPRSRLAALPDWCDPSTDVVTPKTQQSTGQPILTNTQYTELESK